MIHGSSSEHAVGTGQPDRAALRTPRHRMKHGKAHEGVGHHDRGGHDLRQISGSSAKETECQCDGQRDQCHRRQCRARHIRPGTLQQPRYCGDLCGEPQVERKRCHDEHRRQASQHRHHRLDKLFDVTGRPALERRKGLQQRASKRFGGGIGALAEHERQGGSKHGEACDPEQDTAERIPFDLRCSRRRTIAGGGIGHRPSQQREMAEPPGRQRHGDRERDAIAHTEKDAEPRSGRDAADRCGQRPPSERRHHERQRCHNGEQQRDRHARHRRGEHQRRRTAGCKGNEDNRDHQLSRSFRAVRGRLDPNHRRPDDPEAL